MDYSLQIITLLTLINSVVLLIVTMWSVWLHQERKRLSGFQTKFDKKESAVEGEAHKKAQQIINKALEKAGDYLGTQAHIEKDQLNLLKKSLDNIIREDLLELEEIVRDSEKNNTELSLKLETELKDYFDKLAQNSSKQTDQLVSNLGQSLQNQFAQIIKDTQTRFDVDYKKATAEIDLYKQSKLQSLDQQAQDLIESVAKEVLPKSISLQDHYQLTVEALERAKKAGLVV